MKITLLLSLILSFSAFAGTPSAELREIIKNPPSISESSSGGFTVPKDGGAILIGPGFISYISLFEEKDSDSASYKFRTYSTIHKLEIGGEGKVFERYYRISDPTIPSNGTSVIDKGSNLQIDAGLFLIEWSVGRHLYARKDTVKIQAGTEAQYLELIRK